MPDSRTAEELTIALDAAMRSGPGGESIDRLSILLLRVLIAEQFPTAAWLGVDWGSDGLDIGELYDAADCVIASFDPGDDATFPGYDPITLASNFRILSHADGLLAGPNNGPLRLAIR